MADLTSQANNVLSLPKPKPPVNDFSKSLKSGDGGQTLKFPLDLSQEYTTDNIIRFTILQYAGGGYSKLKSEGQQDNAVVPVKDIFAKIYLSMPAAISTNVSAEWKGTEEISDLAMMGIDMINNGMPDWNSLANAGIAKQLQFVEKFMGGKGSVFSNTASAAAGMKIQPFQEQLFENINYRKNKFNFKLVPRSAKELDEISKIITAFRWAASPGLAGPVKESNSNESAASATGTNLLSYPNIFNIKYLCANKDRTELIENKWLNKIHPSICNSVLVTYSSEDAKNFLSYSDEYNGAPIYYMLSLEFTELVMVTKDAINVGY